MDNEIAHIAKGLTWAQEYALTWLGTTIGCVASNRRLADSLVYKGLAVRTPYSHNARMLDWTKRGRAVRDHILREKSGG